MLASELVSGDIGYQSCGQGRGGGGAGSSPACCSNRCVLQHCSTAAAAPCTQHCTAPHCNSVSRVSICIDVSRHRPTLAVSLTEGCVQGSAGCSSSSVPTFEAATTHQPRSEARPPQQTWPRSPADEDTMINADTWSEQYSAVQSSTVQYSAVHLNPFRPSLCYCGLHLLCRLLFATIGIK